jgi:Zn-dependent alcohol dehydrogenase
MSQHRTPGAGFVRVWWEASCRGGVGMRPVGQFAIASAYLPGAERVIAIDRFPFRLRIAEERAGAETINYEEI